MGAYSYCVGAVNYQFADLKGVLAKASPARSGDYLVGVVADTYAERMAARMCLAEISLKTFLEDLIIPFEADEVTRLIVDTHDEAAFAEISHLTVGDFRDWLLSDFADTATLKRVATGITPEMAAAVSKLMRNQDLILVAKNAKLSHRFAIPSACQAIFLCVCNLITLQTICGALRPLCSMVCCTARVMQ